ncbi:MAG: glycosyltransferase family 4 protein [Lachnospiraceae bacterium]|nr:glycosyltransferase family 4 protein [Lachnospiraceae bacterium]
MKIVLIGPVYPYKGGIAHYTSLLCAELRKRHEVEMVSYCLQYPRFLYKKEQKDYQNKSFAIQDTKYWLNTVDPFNWIRTAFKIRKWKPDLVIMEWWHPYFAPCDTVLSLLLRKFKKLFICHNVFPHERFPMDRLLTKTTLKRGNKFIVQSQMDADDLKSIIPKAEYIVTPHPTYNAFKMSDMNKEEARRIINLDMGERMILFFGFVREYKGLKYLLKALPLVKQNIPAVKLWIVGDFGDDKEEYLKLIADNDLQDNIMIVDGYVPDKEVEKYFAATDLVALPYISATQSGIVQIAFGFEKPVIVTNVGGLPDVVEDGKTGYIVNKENENELAEAIVKFFSLDSTEAFTENIRDKAQDFSWETMVDRIEKLIEEQNEA